MPNTFFRSFTQLSFLLIAFCAISQAVPATFQMTEAAQVKQTAPKSLEEVEAENAKSKWLDPVLDNLRSNVRGGDPSLLDLLKEVQIWTFPKPRDYVPNAEATYKDGKPVIYVDLPFLNQSNFLQGLAGLLLTGSNLMKPTFEKAMLDYKQSIAHAGGNKLKIPPFSFNPELDINDAATRTVAKRFSEDTFNAGVAWVVLHEIAHHKLGHLDLDEYGKLKCKPTPAEARDQELEADTWAFAEMKKLGYGLAPLDSLFIAHVGTEQVRIKAGVEHWDENSDHPNWVTRWQNLRDLHFPFKPPQNNFIVILYPATNKLQKFEITETIIPRDPESEGWLYAFQGDTFLAYEWKNDQIHLYGRSDEVLQETIIHQPNEVYPEMTVRENPIEISWLSDLQSKYPDLLGPRLEPSEVMTRVYQTDYAWAQSGPLKGAWQFTPRKWFLEVLTQVTTSSENFSSAEKIFMKHVQETRRILIKNARGELTEAAARQQYMTSTENYEAGLRKTLGDAKFNKFRETMMADPRYSIAVDKANELLKKTTPR